MTLQVVGSILEGLSLRAGEPAGGPASDVLHRLGYPFRNLGGTTVLFLVVAVALVSLPPLLRHTTTARQELVAGLTLGLASLLAVVIALGSVLAVRYHLHLYATARRAVPAYVRAELGTFLVGTLGTAAVALAASLLAMGLRDRGRR